MAPIDIELAIEGPFSMRSGKERIVSGINPLPVTYGPRGPGSHTGRVFVYVGDEIREVLLAGFAQQPPGCVPSAPCRQVAFDPETGQCSETVVPDHTPCRSGNLCQENEICLAGECVGTPVDCDDDSVCTADSCDPARGCVHLDITAQICEAPTDPCLVASCHPELGCGATAVVDGTICGEANCRFADICIGGECGRFEVPDGTECTHACGDGKCRDGECRREDGDRLRSLWTIDIGSAATVHWAAIADALGQLYWLEELGGSAHLVSATATGVVRYRAPLPWSARFDARSLVVEGTLVLVGAADFPAVSAHDPATGAEVWARALDEEIEEALACPCTVSLGSLTRTAEGRVLYAARIQPAAGATSTILATLHASSGDVLDFEVLAGGLVAPPIADEAGVAYVHLGGAAGSAEVVAWDAAAGERWRVAAAPDASPLAAWDGLVQLGARDIVDTADGSKIDDLGLDRTVAATPILGPEGNWWFTVEPDGNAFARPWRIRPDRMDGTPAPFFDTQDPLQSPGWTEAILTRRDTVLVATSRSTPAGWETLLREIQDDGTYRRTCDLGVEGRVLGPLGLRSGRLFARIVEGSSIKVRAWDLPNGDPGVRGWISPHGNPAGGGRPQ